MLGANHAPGFFLSSFFHNCPNIVQNVKYLLFFYVYVIIESGIKGMFAWKGSMTPTAHQEGVQLQEWANAHQPNEKLIFKDGYWHQIIFVRDKVAELLAKTYEECKAIQSNTRVISTHISKSVLLPVFKVELVDGTKFIMRYNFHNWKVSVDSPRDVRANFMGLFNPYERIHEVYCEGFPKEVVYGPYAKNKRQFTIELPPENYHLFMFFWIFAWKVLKVHGMR